ncbi:MAG: urea ABC transporter permease subunit UrtC [Flavobacteriaceae bacterium]|jgi:urea transport system permease protein|nr:urea ABC transporter permease subunit UrtC [Flavobacteriaceae bacterium]
MVKSNKLLYILFLLIFLILIPLSKMLGFIGIDTVTLWGRYCCFAIAAIGVDLIWGYTGVMTMCHAFFFCLGAYGLGMYMTISNLPEGQAVPDFMSWNQVESLPFFWLPFRNFPMAVFSGLLITGVFAFLFSYFIFRRRIKGVFFAIITQAFALAMYLLFSRNETMLGGSNGLTNFRYLAGLDLRSENVKIAIYITTVLMLILIYFLSKRLTLSKFGKVLIGIRDSESRLRFAGYEVSGYQTTIFVIGALIAATAGMLYIPQTGIITPGRMDVKASIEMLIWVALGGRGSLKGAVAGALIVNALYSMFTSLMPEAWPYILGILYILTVLYLNNGIIGLLDKKRKLKNKLLTSK